jgi:plasmid stability protein
MSNVQVKHVDPETHEALRQRAAAAGMTLGEYVLELIRKDLRRPSRAAWLDQVRTLPQLDVDHDAVLADLDQGRADR